MISVPTYDFVAEPIWNNVSVVTGTWVLMLATPLTAVRMSPLTSTAIDAPGTPCFLRRSSSRLCKPLVSAVMLMCRPLSEEPTRLDFVETETAQRQRCYDHGDPKEHED